MKNAAWIAGSAVGAAVLAGLAYRALRRAEPGVAPAGAVPGGLPQEMVLAPAVVSLTQPQAAQGQAQATTQQKADAAFSAVQQALVARGGTQGLSGMDLVRALAMAEGQTLKKR